MRINKMIILAGLLVPGKKRHCEKFLYHRTHNNIIIGGICINMNPVVHFEMPAKDKNRMRNFYETAFGWQTEQLGKGLADGDWRNDEKWHP